MANVRRRKARYVQTLVYIDEPQLVLLATKAAKIVGVAVELPDFAMPFLGVTVSDADWDKYIRGHVDLRYLFEYPRFRKLYVFELTKLKNEHIYMSPWEGAVPDELLPSQRFFARHHTEKLGKANLISEGSRSQNFTIDGEWDLPEFGRFYSKISDVYAFCYSLAGYRAGSLSDLARGLIKHAFSHYPLRGGSSYVGLYDDLEESLASGGRLSVESIAYASPGHVAVNGDPDIFSDVRSTIDNFRDNREEIGANYRELYKFLSKRRLLRIGSTRATISSGDSQYILQMAKGLGHSLRCKEVDLVHELAGQNALATAKIMLSYYRRVEQSFLYFAEGRVEFDEPNAV